MKTGTPFFSIIIPTYNRAHLILKTLNTVFAQTFSDYEIIVVDNCSSDNTNETLDPLVKTGKVKFIKHDKNYERAKSRNTGMENAKGNFVTFLDSDDLMYPDNLKDAFEFVQLNRDIKLFQNLYELVNENSEPIYQYKFNEVKNHNEQIAAGNFFSCIGNFISNEIYCKYKFDTAPELQGIEDWEFWMRIMADYIPARINKVNNGIVHHSGRSITAYSLESFINKKNYILGKFKNDHHLFSVYKPYLKLFEASCCLLAASQGNSAGLFREAKKFILMALRVHPFLIFNVRFLRILQISIFKIKNAQGI